MSSDLDSPTETVEIPPSAPTKPARRRKPSTAAPRPSGGGRGTKQILGKRAPKDSLFAWRLSQQLSQREAASILGISQAAYARYELEKRFVRGKLAVKKFRIVTGLPLHVIMGIDE